MPTTWNASRVDDGDLGLAPEADVEPVARLVEGQAIGVAVGLERDLALERTRLGVEPAERVAEGGGDVERLAVLGDAPGRRACAGASWPARRRGVALGQELLAVGVFEDGLVREQAVGVVEPVDQVVEPAADEELLAVGRPGHAGEAPRHGDPADDLAVGGVDRHDLVLAVAGVEDRQDRLARVDRDLHGEVAQLAPAGRPA